MVSTLRRTALHASTLTAAVAYTTATVLDSTTAVVDDAQTSTATELINNSSKLVRVAQAAEVASVVSENTDSGAVSIVVPSSALIKLIPVLRDLTQRKRAVVLHVALGTADDISNVLAVRDSGCAVLRSSSAQQTIDFAVVATLAAQKLALPFIHCFTEAMVPVDVQTYEPVAVQAEFAEFLKKAEEETSTQSQSEATHAAVADAMGLFGSGYMPVAYAGAANASVVYVTFGAELGTEAAGAAGVVQVSLFRPLCAAAFVEKVPATVKHLVAFEQVTRQPTAWGPLLFDLAAVLHSSEWEARGGDKQPVLLDAVSAESPAAFAAAQLAEVTAHAAGLKSPAHFNPAELVGIVGNSDKAQNETLEEQHGLSQEQQQKRVEQIPYGHLLRDMFKERLNVANAAESRTIWGEGGQESSNPEFGFGRLAAWEQERGRLVQAVTTALRDISVPLSKELQAGLSTWLSGRNDAAIATVALAEQLGTQLEAEQEAHPAVEAVFQRRAWLTRQSNWLVGADEWAYDVGASGVHHVISSELNVNMLVLETAAYPFAPGTGRQRKKDIGLYAMSYGTAYVASVAVYASYTQVLQALAEADAFPGPAVVVAYLPHSAGVFSTSYSPIEVLRQSKQAVDSGAWPLYRWDPTADAARRFQLDSERLRRAVADFLRRENALAAAGNAEPQLDVSEATEARAAARLARKARGDVDALVGGLGGPGLLVLYASDNGNGEEAARRVARQGRRRGMAVRCVGMDAVDADELAFERTVVAVVSTAGQGEVPTNGREFFKQLQAASANFSETAFAVFGLGDSHYWPRAEDALFYNKPARDLDRRLAELGAARIVDVGLGDDQDADGWESGFGAFEQRLWGALNLDVVAGAGEEDGPKRTDEENKLISNFLRGTIAQAIADDSTGAVDEWDGKLLKFHGTYMQDDRDLRAERMARGAEKAFSFMIRVRLPGGVATPEQWLAMDRIADSHGNGSLKITTRQTFQLHGVLKRNLRDTMRSINRALMDTIAACGDVNRNVVASANPLQAHLQPEVAALAAELSSYLLPATSAYHEIWLGDEQVAGSAEQTSGVEKQTAPVADHEPLYGPTYLPRKFKIAIAIPPENDVDVVAYDLGLIAILDDSQRTIVGYNVMVGGGMGMTHNNRATYPRLASCLGFVTKDAVLAVAKAVLLVQRDHGDRVNRKHARLKYTVDDHGLPWWRAQVEVRMGARLEEPRPYEFTRNGDRYGWVATTPGLNNFTMFVQNGRVVNLPGRPLKDALAAVARKHTGLFRLTCNGHLIVADVRDEDVPAMSALLASHGLDNLDYSALRLHSMACVALPTCGLAMAESERYLPRLIDLLDAIIDSAGLRNDAIVIRMTGCPNGCARPYNAEIAFVGKAPGAYNLYLGGSHSGERLNKLYRETVTEDQILELLTPIIKQYALERLPAEHFGDFVIRKGIVKETREGKDFHD